MLAEKPRNSRPLSRRSRQPLFAHQTAEFHFKAQNLGTELWARLCQCNLTTHPANWFGWHLEACRLLSADTYLNREKICPWNIPSRVHQSVLEDGGALPKAAALDHQKAPAAPPGLHQHTHWLGMKALHAHPYMHTQICICAQTDLYLYV